MPSLKKLNAEAGTDFRRWKQVAAALKEQAMPEETLPRAEYHDDKFVLHFDDSTPHFRMVRVEGEWSKLAYAAPESPFVINYGWPEGHVSTPDGPNYTDYGPYTKWTLFYVKHPDGHDRNFEFGAGLLQWEEKWAEFVYEGEK